MRLKTPIFRSRSYLAHVGGLGCCICQAPAEAHHLLRTPQKAMGRKSGDDWCIGLCPEHHRGLHADGDETRYLESHGIDGPELARATFERWGNS